MIGGNQDDFQEQPKDVEPHWEVPQLLDGEGHQHAAASQEKRARADKSHRVKEVAVGAELEPCRIRKGNIGGEKHQSKQRGNDNIKHLADGFCQTFRRLRYQAFWEFHRFFLQNSRQRYKKTIRNGKLQIVRIGQIGF